MTKDEAGNEIEVPPVIAQQILARKKERKAKSTLLMAIPDEHLARFHGIKDAKTLWAAIKTRFGGNAESKKMQKNKPDIDNLDIDDLYNNLKVYEADIKGSSGSSSNSQNAQGSSLYADELMFLFFANQSSSLQLDNEDLEQIDQDDLEETDLKWQVAMLSMRVKQFYKKTRRNLEFNGKEPIGFDKIKGRDAGNTGYRGRDNGKRPAREEDEKTLVVQDGLGTYDWSYQLEEEATDFALMAFTSNPSTSLSSNSEREKLRKANLEIVEEEVTKTMFNNRSSDKENSLANDRFKKGKGNHAVPPPLIGNYMPPKPDLSFARLDDSIYKFKISETVTSLTKDVKNAPDTSIASVEKPKEVRTSAPLIQD
nr:ribonuclease H-like domain-containing protein [Tanacetum cinerariifolium]